MVPIWWRIRDMLLAFVLQVNGHECKSGGCSIGDGRTETSLGHVDPVVHEWSSSSSQDWFWWRNSDDDPVRDNDADQSNHCPRFQKGCPIRSWLSSATTALHLGFHHRVLMMYRVLHYLKKKKKKARCSRCEEGRKEEYQPVGLFPSYVD